MTLTPPNCIKHEPAPIPRLGNHQCLLFTFYNADPDVDVMDSIRNFSMYNETASQALAEIEWLEENLPEDCRVEAIRVKHSEMLDVPPLIEATVRASYNNVDPTLYLVIANFDDDLSLRYFDLSTRDM